MLHAHLMLSIQMNGPYPHGHQLTADADMDVYSMCLPADGSTVKAINSTFINSVAPVLVSGILQDTKCSLLTFQKQIILASFAALWLQSGAW